VGVRRPRVGGGGRAGGGGGGGGGVGGGGVRAAPAIVRRVGQVRCKKEIFICGLKNNPYLCGSIITFIKVSELYVSR